MLSRGKDDINDQSKGVVYDSSPGGVGKREKSGRPRLENEPPAARLIWAFQKSAPLILRSRTTSRWPFSDATINTMLPLLAGACTLAFAASGGRTTGLPAQNGIGCTLEPRGELPILSKQLHTGAVLPPIRLSSLAKPALST